jgi:integrase/recombinase XerD
MRKDCWQAGDGPLVRFAEVFRNDLVETGHPSGSLKHYLILMGQLNSWLVTEGLDVEDLCVATATRFLESRRASGYARVLTMASLEPLFECLRAHGVVAPEQPVERTATDELLGDYRHHLEHDRNLAPRTVRRYMDFARRFLLARASRTGCRTGAEGLSSAEVNSYILERPAPDSWWSRPRGRRRTCVHCFATCLCRASWSWTWALPCLRWRSGAAGRCPGP